MTSHSDQVPLLNQRGEAYEEQPDHRFAIDEETAETQDVSNSQHDSPESPKYPPSAPPPSYREATGKSLLSLVYSRVFTPDSMPDFSFLQRGLSKVWMFLCRFWPTSRFAQVGFFMLGLWLLVIVSGPAFEDAGPRAGAGYPWSSLQELANNGPRPISGDGHIASPTNWTLRSCQNSIPRHGQVVCISTTKIELDIPPAKSFNSNEGLFIFADPPREDHLGDGRGQVPGTIEFQLVEEGSGPDQVPAGKVHVVVDAEYEQNKIEVFEKSTIVKMASRIYSQGVGIYTFPLPSRYQHLDTFPLTLFIKVLVPAGSLIPSFRAEASAMNIGAFSQPDALQTTKDKSVQVRTASPLAPAKFGRLVIRTDSGMIRTGKEAILDAIGIIHFHSTNGDINLSGKIHSQEVRVDTINGNIRLEEGCQVTASRESLITTKLGTIELRKNSWILSGELLGKSESGGIEGGAEGGVWKTNKTLQLHTTIGPIRAAIEIVKSTDQSYNHVDVVYVDAESKNGNVEVTYVGHEEKATLHSTVTALVGSAAAKMHKNFEGFWSAEGLKEKSKVTRPADGDSRQFKLIAKNDGIIKVQEKGEIWFNSSSKHDEKAQASVKSSVGAAHLEF